ncbi:MAG: pyruvate kinase [Bdellovibrionota bacterium]
MNLPLRRAKIVATLGPSSSDSVTIENLIKAGVNVFRFNFSHGTKEDHQTRFDTVREAAKKLGRAVAILQDLQGPKLRVGKFPAGIITLEKGQEIVLRLEGTENAVTSASRAVVPYNYERLAQEIKVGHRILMDDGNLEVVVTGINDQDILAQVVFGGPLKNHKGMNFPDTNITIDSFTPKDREDLLFGLKLGVDYVALSFVRTANDVRTVQKFMHAHRKNIPVVSKIEKGEAIANLKEILEVTDAVMVARGDLAVEVGTAQVPTLQKQIIRECNARGIPVITATQMLESMINLPRPTRAEASDVANAVLDGTDAVMLSAETASGKFPVLTVSVMHNIILETEQRVPVLANGSGKSHPESHSFSLRSPSLVDAIEHAAANLATWVGAKAIACTTHTGQAAQALARYRPTVPIMAFTDNPAVQRKLALVWGVQTCETESSTDIEKLFDYAEEALVNARLVEKGDLVVLTAGWPPLKHGTTNLLKVVTVRKESAAAIDEARKKPKKASGPFDENISGYRTEKAQFVLDQNLCIQCGGCVEVCPNDIFGVQNRRVHLKEPNCKNCTFDDACMQICPTGAVEVIRLSD